jgi:hypothetical protein
VLVYLSRSGMHLLTPPNRKAKGRIQGSFAESECTHLELGHDSRRRQLSQSNSTPTRTTYPIGTVQQIHRAVRLVHLQHNLDAMFYAALSIPKQDASGHKYATRGWFQKYVWHSIKANARFRVHHKHIHSDTTPSALTLGAS